MVNILSVKKQMYYQPPLEIITALNIHRFYHGSYFLIENDINLSDLDKFYNSFEESKWDEPCWESFGGFYISEDIRIAQSLAEHASDFINFNNP